MITFEEAYIIVMKSVFETEREIIQFRIPADEFLMKT